MLQATGIAPRPQSEAHTEEKDVVDTVKGEEIVINVDSDEEKERELLVRVNLYCSIRPIY